VLSAAQLSLYVQTAGGWSPVAKSVALKPWQVPALQGVGIVTDGSSPPAPPAPGSGAGGGSNNPTIVPYVPQVC